MPIGRLNWNSPTGAMLWEIWGRRKINFACHAAGLLAAAASVHAIQHASSEIVQTLFKILLLAMFMGALLDVVTIFAYVEVNAQKVLFGFPGRLLLKPVGALRLALTPMIAGGAMLATLLGLWKWILEPLLPSDLLNPFWIGAVTLSFFWWMQALGWSLPYFLGRSLVLLLVAAAHLLVGLIPLSQFTLLLRWRAAIVLFMLVSALVSAVVGLRWTRSGRWEGPSRIGFWTRFASRRVGQKFGSAFKAQFWLEWSRQGCVLPGMCGAIVAVIIPLVYLIQKQEIGPPEQADIRQIFAGMLLTVPLLISGAMGPAMARFDPLRPAGDLPVYISVRPMTNGAFVVTKMAVALASSALTWLIMAVFAGVLLAFLHPVLPYGLPQMLLGCGILFCLLVLLTWNNLVSGIAAGLTGRPWAVNLFGFVKAIAGSSVVGLIIAAKYSEEFRHVLVRWLPLLLGLCLTVKLAASASSLYWGRRRRMLSGAAVTLIAAVWFVGGSFLAGEAFLICQTVNQSAFAPCGMAAAFLLMPFEGLALAPLAMAWNRHR